MAESSLFWLGEHKVGDVVAGLDVKCKVRGNEDKALTNMMFIIAHGASVER